MSVLNSQHKRSSRPLFPYAVLPEKTPFWTRRRKILVVGVVLVLVAGAAGVVVFGA